MALPYRRPRLPSPSPKNAVVPTSESSISECVRLCDAHMALCRKYQQTLEISPWYMTDSTAVLEDSYSEVVVNVLDLALNWQLFSDVGRPRSFVNVMSTNSTLDPVSTVLCRMLL